MYKKLFAPIILCLFLLMGLYIIFRGGQENISYIENRNLATTQELKYTSYTNNSFQSTLENVLVDQFPDRFSLVKEKNEVDYLALSIFYRFLNNPLLLNPIGDGYVNQIGNSQLLMTSPLMFNMVWQERILRRIEQINQLKKDYPDLGVYVYKPTQIHETNIFDEANGMISAGEIYNNLYNQLDVPYDSFKINTLEEYSEYFYTTDHHWNNRGSYIGYKQIMSLMGLENYIINPIDEVCIEEPFFGTYSSQSGFVTEGSPFCVYEFDLPPYKIFDLSGEIEVANGNDFAQKSEYGEYGYYYNEAYRVGDGYTKIVTENTDKENILIIGDSYAGPILPLMTNAFNEITLIYPTNYKALTKEDFNYDKYIKENNIDKILFMYTIENYYLSDQWGDRYLDFDVYREVE